MIEIRPPSRHDSQTVAAAIVTPLGSTDVWYRSTHPMCLAPEAWLSVALPPKAAPPTPAKRTR